VYFLDDPSVLGFGKNQEISHPIPARPTPELLLTGLLGLKTRRLKKMKILVDMLYRTGYTIELSKMNTGKISVGGSDLIGHRALRKQLLQRPVTEATRLHLERKPGVDRASRTAEGLCGRSLPGTSAVRFFDGRTKNRKLKPRIRGQQLIL
jgi:hypothetical protein